MTWDAWVKFQEETIHWTLDLKEMALDAAKMRAEAELEAQHRAYDMLGHRATFQSKIDLMTAEQEFEALQRSQERELLQTEHQLKLSIAHPFDAYYVQME